MLFVLRSEPADVVLEGLRVLFVPRMNQRMLCLRVDVCCLSRE